MCIPVDIVVDFVLHKYHTWRKHTEEEKQLNWIVAESDQLIQTERTMAQVPECIVCLQPYDETLHIPRLLSCGHSFCELCLQQLQSSSAASSGPAVIRCPECSHRTRLSAGGHQTLPKNIELLRLLPSLIREPIDSVATDELAGLVEIRLQQWTMSDQPSVSTSDPPPVSHNSRNFSSTAGFGHELPTSSALACGESLVSISMEFTFTNEEDGNLSIYDEGQNSIWDSRTWGRGRGDLMLLTDGNLVLFDTQGTGKPVWASMSQGTTRASLGATAPCRLVMQDDGNLVIYGANDVATWATWSETSSGLFTNSAGKAEMPSVVTWLQTCETLVSRNGLYKFVNQGDGNLCIYNQDGTATWASRSLNKGAGNLYMQTDGDLVLYNTDGDVATSGVGHQIRPIWSSGTGRRGIGPYKLIMQDDGNLVIHDKNSNPIWTSSAGAVWGSFTRSELPANSSLHPGESLVSEAEEYTFSNQDDGNLVTYTKNGQPTWASGTGPGTLTQGHLKLLTDGNLVLFDTNGSGNPVWASMSQGISRSAGPYRLVMQDDGNLVIYGNSGATWATRTLDTTSGRFTSVAGTAEMPSVVTWLRTFDTLVSGNGLYTFVNRGDGNLCVYNRHGEATWASGTSNRGAGNLYMQRDGDLVLYNTVGEVATRGSPIWSSGTFGRGTGPYKLVMEDDGNLVIYDRNRKPTWAANKLPRPSQLPTTTDTLLSGQVLQTNEKLVSTNTKYTFVNQGDGNLVIYNEHGRARWASATNNYGVGNLYMHRGGKLVLYRTDDDAARSRAPIWFSGGRRGTAPYKLVMQDDGNLVIYDSNHTPTWATNSF